MKYPYFRGLEADRYSFYRVPKALIKVDLFEKMSGDAKLLYAVLLDRMNLSLRNGWQDENGNAYIICTIDEIMDSIRCARQKAVKLLDELEHEYQLIERRRQGLGKPNLLYVKDLYAGLSQSNYWKYENQTSGGLKSELPGVWKSNGSKTDAELKSLLPADEYSEARASTLNAFYTSPTVIKAMYEALSNMGLSKGNVLEPSCGVGNFMGLVPESMENIKMYGVELDNVSGRIAQQLYQKNKIAVQGFERMQFPDSFFDCVVGNVPFGNYKVPDKRYDRHNFLIHDYFIAKSLDLVRPGGVVAVVTSSGTMDKKDSSVREYLANRADLVGAIRLPNNAFQRNANTSVVADILFLQKRDRAAVERAEWVDLGTTPEG